MFDPKDFVDMEVEGNGHEFDVGTDPYKSPPKKQPVKNQQ
jgi:hypothetical protein